MDATQDFVSPRKEDSFENTTDSIGPLNSEDICATVAIPENASRGKQKLMNAHQAENVAGGMP